MLWSCRAKCKVVLVRKMETQCDQIILLSHYGCLLFFYYCYRRWTIEAVEVDRGRRYLLFRNGVENNFKRNQLRAQRRLRAFGCFNVVQLVAEWFDGTKTFDIASDLADAKTILLKICKLTSIFIPLLLLVQIPPALQFNAQTKTTFNNTSSIHLLQWAVFAFYVFHVFSVCLQRMRSPGNKNYFRNFIELIFDLTATFSLSLVFRAVCVKLRAVILHSRVRWIPVITLMIIR